MKQLVNQDSGISVEVVNGDVDPCSVAEVKSHTGVGREDCEDGFYVCDLGDVVLKHKRWLELFPRIHPHYAIKCNSTEVLLKLLIAMDTCFDCASKSEISQMIKLGVDPSRIIFANPCKQSSHVVFAKKQGVKMIVFDNEIELHKIKKHYKDAKLLLRIQTDDSASVCRFSMKYGAHPDTCQFLLDTAKLLELDVIGISFHVGSGCQDPMAFVQALQHSRKLFYYAEVIGYNFTLLDIGGGFPGTKNVTLTFEQIAAIVNETLDDLFPSNNFENLKIIAEPGRYYAASAFTLVTNVIAKRKVARDKQTYDDTSAARDAVLNATSPDNSDEPAFMYFLNDGLYGSFNCLFYDHAEVKPTVMKDIPSDALEYSSSVWGPTCDGLDRVLESCMLPELHTGDWIVWKDMGAYTIAAGSAFNGFKTSSIYYFMSDENLTLLKELSNNASIPKLKFTEVSFNSN